jgi:hypothetical protein
MLQPGGVSVLALFQVPVRKSAHLKFFMKLMKIASLKSLIHETLPYPGPRKTFAVETVVPYWSATSMPRLASGGGW